MKREFLMAFEVTRSVIFEVKFYTLSSNSSPYFVTSANVLNRPKTDYNSCGQGQEDALMVNTKAHNFYKKWNKLHLKNLSQIEYDEIINDIDLLKEEYNYIALVFLFMILLTYLNRS